MSATKPVTVAALFRRAARLQELGRLAEASNAYLRIITHSEHHWPAYLRLSEILSGKGRRTVALVALERAAAAAPDAVPVWRTLGRQYRALGRFNDSLAAFERALAIEPDNPRARFGIGMTLREANRPDDALACFDQVAGDPAAPVQLRAESRWNRALCMLTLGRYVDAWPDYERRVEVSRVSWPTLPGRRWNGEPIGGKTIGLVYEQRFGDVLQFIRFVPRLKALGGRVIVQCPPVLQRLLARVDGVDELVVGAALPACDYYLLATSIPAVLRIGIDEVGFDTPYLTVAPEDRSAAAVPGDAGGRRVGLIWAGKPNPERSLPLDLYVPLMRHPEAIFYSFQLGEHSRDIRDLGAQWLIHDLAPQIDDFYDSSILLSRMDLLITVDTAAAHQAGGLGIPTWLMAIHAADWRWGLAGEDCPWYPGMRLFRQQQVGDWSAAAAALDTAFTAWLSAATPR